MLLQQILRLIFGFYLIEWNNFDARARARFANATGINVRIKLICMKYIIHFLLFPPRLIFSIPNSLYLVRSGHLFRRCASLHVCFYFAQMKQNTVGYLHVAMKEWNYRESGLVLNATNRLPVFWGRFPRNTRFTMSFVASPGNAHLLPTIVTKTTITDLHVIVSR